MTSRIEELRRRMEEAAAAMDFEETGKLRDQISLLRGQDGAPEARRSARPVWSASSRAEWASGDRRERTVGFWQTRMKSGRWLVRRSDVREA